MPRTTAAKRRRSPVRFRKVEVARMATAAKMAGVPIRRIEVDPATGKIALIVGEPEIVAADDLQKLV